MLYWKSRSKTASPCAGVGITASFQSMLYWKSRSKTQSVMEQLELMSFQSMLYWKSRSKFISTKPSTAGVSCFNPCYIGKAVVSNLIEIIYLLLLQFQSMLYWKSRSKYYHFFVLNGYPSKARQLKE